MNDSFIQCGDLVAPNTLPDELKLPLKIIGNALHMSYDLWGMGGNAKFIMLPDKSKESCILASATVRDFLYRIGFRDAAVRAVVFWLDAHDKDDAVIRALGIGNPDGPNHQDGRWDGHMVVTTGNWLIDTTLYQATPRSHWPDFPPMMAAPLYHGDGNWFGLPLVAAGGALVDPENHDGASRIQYGWLDQPSNDSWRDAPDYKQKFRRERVTDHLVKLYQKAKQIEAVE